MWRWSTRESTPTAWGSELPSLSTAPSIVSEMLCHVRPRSPWTRCYSRLSTTRCLIHCEAVLLQLSVTVGHSSTLEQLRVTYFLADMQSHNKTCFNTIKLRYSNCSVLLTGTENVSLLLLMRSRVVGSGRMLQWNLGRMKLFKTKLNFLLFPPPVCFDWNVLRWLPPLVLRWWWRSQHYPGERLHICLWDTGNL